MENQNPVIIDSSSVVALPALALRGIMLFPTTILNFEVVSCLHFMDALS